MSGLVANLGDLELADLEVLRDALAEQPAPRASRRAVLLAVVNYEIARLGYMSRQGEAENRAGSTGQRPSTSGQIDAGTAPVPVGPPGGAS